MLCAAGPRLPGPLRQTSFVQIEHCTNVPCSFVSLLWTQVAAPMRQFRHSLRILTFRPTWIEVLRGTSLTILSNGCRKSSDEGLMDLSRTAETTGKLSLASKEKAMMADKSASCLQRPGV